MEFEDRVFLFPLMPNGVFYALRHGLRAYPLSGKWKVAKEDDVSEGTHLLTYGGQRGPSILAPFSGKIILLTYDDHCLPGEWPEGQSYPGTHLPILKYTLFGMQPVRGSDTRDAVPRAYAQLLRIVREMVSKDRGGILKRLTGQRPKIPGIDEYRSGILSELDTLSRAQPKIAPMGVNINEYFSGAGQ